MTDPIRTDQPLKPHHDPHDRTHFWCLTRQCPDCNERKHPEEFALSTTGWSSTTSDVCRDSRSPRRKAIA